MERNHMLIIVAVILIIASAVIAPTIFRSNEPIPASPYTEEPTETYPEELLPFPDEPPLPREPQSPDGTTSQTNDGIYITAGKVFEKSGNKYGINLFRDYVTQVQYTGNEIFETEDYVEVEYREQSDGQYQIRKVKKIDLTTTSKQEACIGTDTNWIAKTQECERISQEYCEVLGGQFDECASPCRNDPDVEACIQICVPVCRFRL